MGIGDFIGRIGDSIGNAPPEAWFSLAQALTASRDPLQGLAQGAAGFGQQIQESRKKRSLADALEGAMGGMNPQQAAFAKAVMQSDPSQAVGLIGQQLFTKPADKPNDIREYEFAKSQGFNGSFMDYQTALRRSGASNTSVTVGGERAFDKGVGEWQAKSFGDMATEGMNAKADLAVIGELETRLNETPGGFVGGIQQLGNSIGIPIGKGASDAQAANAIIARLVPSQRQPGSGQMSDRDVALFRDSLPKLINTPEGNALVIATMKAMAQFKVDQAKIAAAAMNMQLSRQQATEALMNLPDPMEQFKARLKGGSVTPGPRKVLKFNPATGAVE